MADNHNDPVAKAITLLAQNVLKSAEMLTEELAEFRKIGTAEIFGHELCLALRSALFGTGADHTERIDKKISESIDEVAQALFESN